MKKIRDDKGYWNQIESYIENHSDASFSHGLCEQCSNELYGDEVWYIEAIGSISLNFSPAATICNTLEV